MIRADIHTHTTFSPDGRSGIEEMIARCEGIRAETYNFIVTGLCPACRAAEAGQAGPHQE